MFHVTNTVCEAWRPLHDVSHYKHGVRGLESTTWCFTLQTRCVRPGEHYMMFHITNTVCEAWRPLRDASHYKHGV